MGKIKLVLGKGLGALIPTDDSAYENESEAPEESGVTAVAPNAGQNAEPNAQSQQILKIGEISVDQIRRNPYQPREEFDAAALEELTNSIREHGVIQPITVCAREDGYELIAGERRLRASRAAGLSMIPAYIKEIVNDTELLELALIENVQREHLNPMEIATGYQRLIDECRLTQEEVSKKVSKDRATVANFLRLLKLPMEIQESLRKQEITTGHARTLVSLPSRDVQLALWKKILLGGLSVRRTEELARAAMKPVEESPEVSATPKTAEPAKELYDVYPDLESRMRTVLATQVKIRSTAEGKGRVEIEFYSNDELTRIIEIIEAGKEE